jgi:hypothetical protein
LSFSAIRTYQTCPLRYYFRYVVGLPERTASASLIFGAAMHRAIEHHYRRLLIGNEPPHLDQLLEHFRLERAERRRELRLTTAEKKEEFDPLAQRVLAAFKMHPMAFPEGRILAVEEELRGNLVPGIPDLLGKLDLVVETDDALIIEDWKSARSRWTEEQVLDAAEQPLLYSELVKDFAPSKQLKISFAVLTKTRQVQIEQHTLAVEPRRVDRVKRIVERVLEGHRGRALLSVSFSDELRYLSLSRALPLLAGLTKSASALAANHLVRPLTAS